MSACCRLVSDLQLIVPHTGTHDSFDKTSWECGRGITFHSVYILCMNLTDAFQNVKSFTEIIFK